MNAADLKSELAKTLEKRMIQGDGEGILQVLAEILQLLEAIEANTKGP